MHAHDEIHDTYGVCDHDNATAHEQPTTFDTKMEAETRILPYPRQFSYSY